MNYLDGFKACPMCRADLEVREVEKNKTRPACSHCDWIHWGNPVPTASAVIPIGSGVLLTKRGKAPQIGFWSLAGGHMENQEHPHVTVVREVKEETNLDVIVTHQIGDPFTTESNHLVMFYLVEVIGGEMKAGDDAAELAVFTYDSLPQDIAWVHHRQAIENYYAVRKLHPVDSPVEQKQCVSNGGDDRANEQNSDHCKPDDANHYYCPSPTVVIWSCLIYMALLFGMCLFIRYSR